MTKKLNLAFVFGTRPETIKLAPVILEARKRGHNAQVILSGQHRQMALPLLEFFGIQPDLNLDVMTPQQTLSSLSAKVINSLDAEKSNIKADYVIVQGDTSTAYCAAYWAFCHKIRVAHVEAGLRTYDLTAPFPEEANRQLIGRIADVHFPPTKSSSIALRKEGIAANRMHVVGNTGIDALLLTVANLKKRGKSDIPESVLEFIGDKKLVLVTAHRRESFGEPFEDLCKGIRAVADARDDIRAVYPVHPNPNVKQVVDRMLVGHKRIMLCDPQPYAAFIDLMKRATVLLTDSGGIQEEAPALKVPILVMRNSTERPEGVKAGYSKLVGTDPGKIKRGVLQALKEGCKGRGPNPYGDGKTSARIIRALEKTK